MRRRTWALLLGIGLAVVVAVGGSLVAIGLGDDSTAVPEGAANALRLKPVSDEVSCGTPAPVYLYLDDLVPRPSPRDADAPTYGAVGFEVPIQYDPAVVRLAAPIDIQLNPQLDIEDSDRDGIVRNFLLVHQIDDYAGRAMVGTVSYVPSSLGPDDNNYEEGIDPVARGEPLLLMTITFTAVGEGTTDLRVEAWETERGNLEPKVFDPDGVFYEPLTVESTSLTVRGGDCPEPPPATPRPTIARPGTPVPEPTETPVAWRTVTAPAAPDVGRTDCPQDWVAYADPQDRFSICYPADFSATASDFALNLRGDSFSIAVSWSSTPQSVHYPPSPENCAVYTGHPEDGTSRQYVELLVQDRTVPACFSQGLLEGTAGPVGSVLGAIPLAGNESEREGFIVFNVGFTGPDVSEVPTLIESVLETLAVEPR
jgi:hypothetical protein